MNWGNIRGTFYTYSGLFKIRTQLFELVPVFGKFEFSPFEIKIRTNAFERITVPLSPTVLLSGSPSSTMNSEPFQTMHQHCLPGGYTTKHVWRPLLKLKCRKSNLGSRCNAYAPFGDWENRLSIAAFIKIHIADFRQ